MAFTEWFFRRNRAILTQIYFICVKIGQIEIEVSMSMQDRLLHEKAKEQELKESVRLAKEALKTAQEQLLLQQGAIKMLEELLQSSILNSDNYAGFHHQVPSVSNRRANVLQRRNAGAETDRNQEFCLKMVTALPMKCLPFVNALLL